MEGVASLLGFEEFRRVMTRKGSSWPSETAKLRVELLRKALKINGIIEEVKKLDKDTLNMYTLPRAEKKAWHSP
jgi:hypothetical protein